MEPLARSLRPAASYPRVGETAGGGAAVDHKRRPVMNDPASESRKPTASRLRREFQTCREGQAFLQLNLFGTPGRVVGQGIVVHRRRNGAGADDVATDALRAIVHGDALTEHDDRSLRGLVGEVTGNAAIPCIELMFTIEPCRSPSIRRTATAVPYKGAS
jgi:hypothetical protein